VFALYTFKNTENKKYKKVKRQNRLRNQGHDVSTGKVLVFSSYLVCGFLVLLGASRGTPSYPLRNLSKVRLCLKIATGRGGGGERYFRSFATWGLCSYQSGPPIAKQAEKFQEAGQIEKKAIIPSGSIDRNESSPVSRIVFLCNRQGITTRHPD